MSTGHWFDRTKVPGKPQHIDLDGQTVKQAATSWDGTANVIMWLDGAPHLFVDGVWVGTGPMAFLRDAADAVSVERWQAYVANGNPPVIRPNHTPMKWETIR